MHPFHVYLDRHDLPEEAASVCKASFAAYHDAEQYAKQVAAAWLDETAPVVVRVTGPSGNVRLFPLRTGIEGY